jgi:hypothetical protein
MLFLLLQSVLDTRKQIFEELLWEHQGLNEVFAALKIEHNNFQGLLEPPGFFGTGTFLYQILTTSFFLCSCSVGSFRGGPHRPSCCAQG